MKKEIRASIVILAVEVVTLLVFMLFVLFQPSYYHRYSAEDLKLYSGIINEQGEAYVDENYSTGSLLVGIDGISLTRGCYNVKVQYTASEDTCTLFAAEITTPEEEGQNSKAKDFTGFVTDTVSLHSRNNEATEEIYVRKSCSEAGIYVAYYGDGSLKVSAITVERTALGNVRSIILLMVFFVFVDFIIWVWYQKKQGKIEDKSITIFMGLLGIIVFSSIPSLMSSVLNSGDTNFHLLRIEGIKEALRMGEWPVKVQPNWLCGNGYAVSIFYGDLLLYFPALLRICGFTIVESYNIFIVICNIATTIISYFCFKGMMSSRSLGVIGRIIYMTSISRLFSLYGRGGTGVFCAVIFLPLVAYGLWKIFMDDIDTPGYSSNWIAPVIGFTGIMQSHMLTCELTGFFTVILCLILLKRVFVRKRFIVLLKIVVFTVLINLGFLIPFFDTMNKGDYIIENFTYFYYGIQQYGIEPGELFLPIISVISNTNQGVIDTMHTVGIAVIFSTVIMLWLLIRGKITEKKYRTVGIIMVSFSLISMWMSTKLFPWNTLQNLSKTFRWIVVTLQFPQRLLSMTALFGVVAGILALKKLRECETEIYKFTVGALIILAVFQAGYWLQDVTLNGKFSQIYSASNLDDCDIIGCEYLPDKSEAIMFCGRYYLYDKLVVEEISRDFNRIEVHVENNTDMDEALVTSLVKYPGYRAVNMATGEKMALSSINDAHVNVEIPAGFNGDILIEYKGMWYWNIGYVISVVSVLGCIVLRYCERYRKKCT